MDGQNFNTLFSANLYDPSTNQPKGIVAIEVRTTTWPIHPLGPITYRQSPWSLHFTGFVDVEWTIRIGLY